MLQRSPPTEVKVVPVTQDPEGSERVSQTVFPFRCMNGSMPLLFGKGFAVGLGLVPLLLFQAASSFVSCFFLSLIGKRHLSSARDNFPFWVAEAGLTSLVTEHFPMFTLSLMSSHHSR